MINVMQHNISFRECNADSVIEFYLISVMKSNQQGMAVF